MGNGSGETQHPGDSSGASRQVVGSGGSQPPQSAVPDTREAVSSQTDSSQADQRASQSPYRHRSSQFGPLGDSHPLQQAGMTQMQGNIPHGQFRMAALGTALPDVAYQNYTYPQQQRFVHGPSPTGMVYQFQPVPQLTVQAGLTPQGSALFNAQYQPQYQTVYAPSQLSSSPPPPPHPGAPPGSQYYQTGTYLSQQTPQQPPIPFFYQTSQYGAQPQSYGSSPSSPQYSGQGVYDGDSRSLPHQRNHEYAGGSGRMPVVGPTSIVPNSPTSSIVRGPPRKPRQSGHALWIGNLPPQTDLMSLVRHVCKETHGLESLFLISKSNCAFANFKDEAACAVAQTKIHDSRFQTVRLVSRLRRAYSGNASSVSAPATSTSSTPVSGDSRVASPEDPASRGAPALAESLDGAAERSLPKDKFFIVKSLTVEDLELSVRNGIWATQSHNEEVLNKAYQTADNVYLIFSANKSGEYFGYARMASPINDDPAAAIEFTPKAPATAAPELPKAIPTPATEFIPKGRIIDDSARGTIFWETERDDAEGGEEDDDIRSIRSDPDAESPPKTWGKPFKVEWLSTTRLPFYRTRGLRNPWNSNREVKIARDGTELETSIGQRLLSLFQHQPSPVIPMLSNMQGMMPIIPPGYPHMRQFP